MTSSALRLTIGTFALLLQSCQTPTVVAPTRFQDAGTVLAQRVVDDDAAFVVLFRDERLSFRYGRQHNNFGVYERSTHVAYQILSEAAFDAANFSIDWPSDGELVELEARTIGVDGTVTPVARQNILQEDASFAQRSGEHVEVEGRTFQFPRVEVGAVVEYAYTVRLRGAYTRMWSTIADGVPVKHYTLDIAVEPGAQPDLMVLNANLTPKLVDRGDGLQHLTLTADNVAAVKREPFSPTALAGRSAWLYRTIAFRGTNYTATFNATWDDVMAEFGRERHRDALKRVAGKTPHLVCPTGEVRCLINTAVGAARHVVATAAAGAGADGAGRDVDVVLSAGHGDGTERAALVWAMLVNAGVAAHRAFVTSSRLGVPVDTSFPTTTWLDRPLIVVEQNDGTLLWVDPACSQCAVGELPAELVGQAAVVAKSIGDKVNALIVTTQGRAVAAPAFTERMYQLTLDDKGGAVVRLEVVTTGAASFDLQLALNDDGGTAYGHRIARELRALFPTDAEIAVTPLRCAEDRCQASATATLASATVRIDDTQTWLALTPLRRHLPPLTNNSRTTGVVVSRPWRGVTRLRVTAPGYSVKRLPDAFVKRQGAARVAFDVASDADGVTFSTTVDFSAGQSPAHAAGALDAVLASAHVANDVVVLAPRDIAAVTQ